MESVVICNYPYNIIRFDNIKDIMKFINECKENCDEVCSLSESNDCFYLVLKKKYYYTNVLNNDPYLYLYDIKNLNTIRVEQEVIYTYFIIQNKRYTLIEAENFKHGKFICTPYAAYTELKTQDDIIKI
jgi:hypothetical protein